MLISFATVATVAQWAGTGDIFWSLNVESNELIKNTRSNRILQLNPIQLFKMNEITIRVIIS